ncbi:hypothetical protein PAXINDRAFT_170081 [Paxillus involutus ATCC 200175]|uniref:Raptor N-terminal CASPase-like domain-containing protein n=1 Tax=Paxillus involutus ATCC 200175 TaxID=664439 RepID=A0A0C9U391_PAXIN|nr:hypothetical protein PAXINDRAFT_170081 [Paxillus involutus ATCC 200175]
MGSDNVTERGWGSASVSDPSSNQTTDGRVEDSGHHINGRRHGSEETLPESVPIIPYWSAKRHLTCGNPAPRSPNSTKLFPWRGSAPGKLKTANAALVLCLNIDVDPPDIIKTNPCAVLECWVDPHTMPSHKALEAIGTNLQHQFEGLSLKIPYKPILDPSYEDLRRFCLNLRKQAKDETVCFYYNGHGVPKPTPSGELWCFNRNYTQYIPVSLMEVQSWLGSPGVYIWDCSGAGHLLTNFITFAERRDQEVFTTRGGYVDGMQPYMNSLQLAACLAHEQLPSCPELPADIFTSCLTSPIDIALRYFIMTHHLPDNITLDMVMQLPGDLKDRRTPLGELNWIFTAITDTIAWTTFPRDVFTRLYRSDLLIASLFRNFLLAERIMKNYHCTPHTYPLLPATNTHSLWAAWDLAVDTCLRQLPDLLAKNPGATNAPNAPTGQTGANGGRASQPTQRSAPNGPQAEKPYQYIPSRFFTDQLTAFEVWISRGGSALTKRGPLSLPPQNGGGGFDGVDGAIGNVGNITSTSGGHQTEQDLVPRKPPDQLPIVLQVLLSQPHRLRALILLSQFVDLGPWAVNLVLTIGIFPYISKLLQAAGQDLRPVLIFIWARILAVDPSVQVDLHNTQGFKYFANVLALTDDQPQHALPNSSEHKAMCAFILSAVARDYYNGQIACWRDRVFDNCFEKLDEGDFLLRQWSALCIAQIWEGNDEIKVYGVDRGTQDKLILMLSDDSPEVRAASLYALGTFMGSSGSADSAKPGGGGGTGTQYQLEERIHFRMEVAVATGATLAVKDDASPMVRKELLVLISCLVKEWRGYFVICAWIYWEEDRKWRTDTSAQPHEEEMTAQAVAEWLDVFGDDDGAREENRVLLSSFFTIFVVLLELTNDPYHEVATLAQTITDYIMALLLASPFFRLECTSLDSPPLPLDYRGTTGGGGHSRVSSLQSSPLMPHPPSPVLSRPSIVRTDSMTNTLSLGVTSTIRQSSRWDRPVANLQVNSNPLSMALHAYDPHLVIANDTDMISVWDWSQRKRVNHFCNGNPKGTSITSLHLINQDVGGIIMTGSADGVVRLYRNYDSTQDQGPLQMVSSFRGLNEMINVRRGSGLVMDWKQSGGSLLVGGDSRVIRVWDAHSESQVLDLETDSESPVTSLASDHGSSSTFVAGFADGVVKVFDRRLEEDDAVVRSYHEHHWWIQNVKYHSRNDFQLLSASLSGEVRLWDIRGSDRAVQVWDSHPGGLSYFDVHPQTSVFATTSALTPTNWRHQRLVIQSISEFNSSVLTALNLTTGLPVYPSRPPSPYIPRSTAFAFHPLEMLYAVGQPDGSVKITGCKFN